MIPVRRNQYDKVSALFSFSTSEAPERCAKEITFDGEDCDHRRRGCICNGYIVLSGLRQDETGSAVNARDSLRPGDGTNVVRPIFIHEDRMVGRMFPMIVPYRRQGRIRVNEIRGKSKGFAMFSLNMHDVGGSLDGG